MHDKSAWNSLEITKILTGVVVAISIAVLTWQLQGVGESSKRISGKQAEIYGKIGPMLNRVISYYFFVGKWKENKPSDIISTKRELDEIVFSNQLYFSSDFFARYNSLMNVLFETGQAWGEDAKLNTTSTHRKTPDETDENEFKRRFTEADRRGEICERYGELLAQMAVDLRIGARKEASCPPIYGI
jgi:hypothetical protein